MNEPCRPQTPEEIWSAKGFGYQFGTLKLLPHQMPVNGKAVECFNEGRKRGAAEYCREHLDRQTGPFVSVARHQLERLV